MGIKLNAGAGPTWRKEGWSTLDHKVKENTATVIEGEAININLEDLSCATVFSSHMLEHIPHVQIEAVLSEFHRVLEEDGILRIVVPDMLKLARAYVNRDANFFKAVEEENETVRTDLGYGGMLANHFVGPGQDTALFSRQLTFIAGYSHLYMYDYEMLKILLSKSGFYNIRQRSFCCSSLPDYEEPFHVEGLEPVWHNLNKKFYAEHNLIHQYDPETGKYTINFKTTGFDRNPLTSLFVECRKTRIIGPESWPVVSGEGHNYNHYSQSLLKDEKFRLKCKIMEAVSDMIEEGMR